MRFVSLGSKIINLCNTWHASFSSTAGQTLCDYDTKEIQLNKTHSIQSILGLLKFSDFHISMHAYRNRLI